MQSEEYVLLKLGKKKKREIGKRVPIRKILDEFIKFLFKIKHKAMSAVWRLIDFMNQTLNS